ncbi:endonuclease/exonuclease/phosphatase family protein [Microbacterium sp.]|uniref:endonuclease/exonuclease/phosphatase family protein n=1 Tax=Microbacterium sp. TaxID=51671 RepID=UPI003A918269
MWVHHVNIRPDVRRTDRNPGRTTVLVSVDLGEYSVIDSADGTSNTGSVPSAVALHADRRRRVPRSPVHAVAPRHGRHGAVADRSEWIADQCPQGDFILGGDFNATLDHMAGRLASSGGDDRPLPSMPRRAPATESPAPGPSSLPPARRCAPIDHVMSSPQNWTPTSAPSSSTTPAAATTAPLVVQLERAGGSSPCGHPSPMTDRGMHDQCRTRRPIETHRVSHRPRDSTPNRKQPFPRGFLETISEGWV